MYHIIDKQQTLKASKFLKQQFLIKTEDLAEFFSLNPQIIYVPVGKIIDSDKFQDSPHQFLKSYEIYQNRITKGTHFEVNDLRGDLSGAFSLRSDTFGYMELKDSKRIYQPILPVLQIQLLSFVVGIDKKIHFSFGKDVTYLGLQVLYPQLFIDQNQEIKNGLKEQDSINATLYKNFVAFLREKTNLLSFQIEGVAIKSHIRIQPEILQKIKDLPVYSKLGMF